MMPLPNGSVRMPVNTSTTVKSPIFWPKRVGCMLCGERLITSEPPATAMPASPSMTACAAETMACTPLPQSRLTFIAGTDFGIPASIADTRER